MKLHRLHIENLNSLRGEVTIDFDAGLGDAPLFLIHGPTGSGKSTLMDAVSLALFGCTPRLGDNKTSPSGDIGATDGRQVMTRGTGHCMARLVFSRVDGNRRRYFVAEWCCARARRRPDGNFQHVDRSIRELASPDPADTLSGGLDAGGKKQSHYLDAFDEALEGTTVEDFHRSMLLAQGEFSRFLKADAKERADILERITDTSDYTELGRRAAERNRQEQERVREQRARLEGVPLLGEEDRIILKTQRDEAKIRAEAESALLAPLTEEQRWVEDARKVLTDISASRERLCKAREEREGRQSDTERLAGHRRTEAAARMLEKRDELDRRRKQIEEQLEKIAVDLGAARDDQGKHLAAQAQANTAAAAAVQALQTAMPDLTSARAIWETVRQLEASLVKAQADVARLQEPVDRLVKEFTESQHASDKAHRNVETKSADWAALALWHALVEDDAPYRTMQNRCNTLVRALEVHTEATAELNGLRSAIEEKRRVLVSKEATAEPLRAGLAKARTDLESAMTALAEYCDEGGDQEATRHRLTADRNEATRLLAILDQVSDDYSRQEELQARIREDQSVSAEHAEKLAALQPDEDAHARHLEGKRSELEAAQKWLSTAKLAVRQVELRRQLVKGHPCPICGSEEHPWADHENESDKASRKALEEAEATVTRIEVEVAAIAAKRQKIAGDISHLSAVRDSLIATIARQKGELAILCGRIAERWQLAGNSGDVSGEALAARRGTLELVQQRADAAVKTLSQAQHRVEEARRAAEMSDNELRSVEGEIGQLRAVLQVQERDLDTKKENVTAHDGRLSSARDAFLVAASAMPPAFPEGDASSDVVTEWTVGIGESIRRASALRDDLKTSRQLAGEAEATVDSVRKRLEDAQGHLKEARHRREAVLGELEAARRATAQFFGGEDPIGVEQGLRGAVEVTREKLDRTKTAVSEVSAVIEGLAGQERVCREQFGTTVAELAELTDVIDRHLFELGVSVEDVRVARLPEDTVTRLEQELGMLGRQLHEAEALVQDAERRMAAHRSACPTALAGRLTLGDGAPAMLSDETLASLEQEITATRTKLEAVRDEARRKESAAQARLEDDDRRRADVADGHERLREAEAAAHVWATLHNLIGRNDGGAFRQFAQSLNLEQILAGANVHLERLRPRYRLVQVLHEGAPTLEFEVEDALQAGDRRPLTTLSGGETFLCSLALALGLAGMRRNRLPIETLLLDEGFGTLDRHSLDSAIAVLEQLHQNGYRVGLISHVELLQERIPAQIEVVPTGSGASEVIVRDGAVVVG